MNIQMQVIANLNPKRNAKSNANKDLYTNTKEIANANANANALVNDQVHSHTARSFQQLP